MVSPEHQAAVLTHPLDFRLARIHLVRTMIDIDAIRARHEARVHNSAAAMVIQICADVDALVAEIERLQTACSTMQCCIGVLGDARQRAEAAEGYARAEVKRLRDESEAHECGDSPRDREMDR